MPGTCSGSCTLAAPSRQLPDSCLLLEHEPVYTAGRRTSPARPAGSAIPARRSIEVDRGGKITWHGPGQLVGYPIVALDEPIDVISYVRAIEEALIRTCADAGLATGGSTAAAASGSRGSRGLAPSRTARSAPSGSGWRAA